ncbi:MAG TPA: hypothetical protein VFP68_07560 [Burkholderiaceae bacterium]|nr:hypothetical protein [Burkholderiaceae bacterium]
MKSIIVINRWPGRAPEAKGWDGELLDYGRLIPHSDFHVIYVVDAVGRSALPPADRYAYDVVEMPSLDDKVDAQATVDALAATLTQRWPALDVWRVVCLSEFSMLIGGLLRSRLGVPGLDDRRTLACRSKLEMRRLAAAAGIREPRFVEATPSTARSLPFGFPVIVKPIIGESSRGVVRIDDEAGLERYLADAPEAFVAEEYIDAPVYHVDGVVREGRVLGFIASRYLNTCLDFNHGRCLGSYIVTEAETNRRLGEAAQAIVTALDVDDTLFHLEVFYDGRDVWFLEIGARMAGADVSYLVHDVLGVNLLEVAVNAELGLPLPALPSGGAVDRSGGWLLLPEPHHYPSRVTRADTLTGRVPGVLRELVPEPGTVFKEQGHYAALMAGRYVVGAPDGDSARARLEEIVRRFRLEYEHEGRPHHLEFSLQA